MSDNVLTIEILRDALNHMRKNRICTCKKEGFFCCDKHNVIQLSKEQQDLLRRM
jgi:hypothetical protein